MKSQRKTRRKTLWLEALLWLAAEIILNPTGLDILADYSEYVFQPRATAVSTDVQVVDSKSSLSQEAM